MVMAGSRCMGMMKGEVYVMDHGMDKVVGMVIDNKGKE